MRTTDRIGFKLVIKEPEAEERTVVVCPRYNGLKMRWNRDNGCVYHTLSIEGSVEFWGVDFERVNACAVRTVFELVLFVKGRGEVGRCEFRKTDCEWDIDHAVCTVNISTKDRYKKFEDGKSNEYNVVKLGLEKNEIGLYVYPQNQVYFQYDDVISLIGHTGTPAQPTVARTLIKQSMIFGSFWREYVALRHEQSGAVYSAVVDTRTDLTENFSIDGLSFRGCCIGERHDYDNTQKVYYGHFNGNNNIAGFLWTLNDRPVSGAYGLQQRNYEYLLTQFGIGYYISTCRIWIPYFRTVSPKSKLYNVSDDIPSNDITSGINNNYKSIVYNIITDSEANAHIAISTRTSNYDKGYGRVANSDSYYDTPDDNQHWVPARKDSWMAGVSIWVGDLYVTYNTIRNFSTFSKIKDFYNLGDVIKAVVKQIDPDVEFENDTEHSAFLFAQTNPVSSMQQGALYISQKSNILKLDYDYPAWLAPVTWAKIETLLKNAFGCYWDLVMRDGRPHLRIEHLTFYMNGGSYSDDTSGILDLTALRDTANRQPTAGKTNRWKWDTSGGGRYSSASRYEFGWMDTQSEIFDGATIEVPDSHRLFTNKKTEERKIDWFSSDIDFLMAVPSECSSDGFAILMEDPVNPGVVISGNDNYAGQNYELSLEYLQPKYLIQGIYAARVKIGDTEYTNTEVANMRTAEVSFQLPAASWETNPVTHETHDTWVSPTERIRTAAGVGVIDTLAYDLHSGLWTATLRYDNE